MNEEDSIAFSKVKTKDIVAAALHKVKAKKMKNSYKRSIGVTFSQLSKENQAKVQREAKDEELINAYVKRMSAKSFIENFESKSYSIKCLDRLIDRYRKTDSYKENELRQKVADVDARCGKS
jgi:hypothetical protein